MLTLDRMVLFIAQAGNGDGAVNAEPAQTADATEAPLEASANDAASALSELDSVDFRDIDTVVNWIEKFAIPLGIGLLKLFLILFISWVLAIWISRFIRDRGEQSKHIDATLARFSANIVKWGILILGLLTALGTVGVQTASFAAILAAAGFAVGLALQGSLSNFAAGVMLLVLRPFKVSDVVKVNGEVGIVDQIDLFTTTMDTFDNRRLIMPNSTIFGNTIENITHHTERRADVDVGVAYNCELEEARRVLTEVANSISTKLPDREVQVVLMTFNASSIDWQLRVWCKREDWLATKEEMILRIKQALNQAGIGIPFPQRDIHLYQHNG